jgi:hypothetical protein
VRALVILAVLLAALSGCDRANSPVEKQEKRGGGLGQAAQEEQPPPQAAASGRTAEGTAGNIPINGVVGESVETPQFDYRIVDSFTTDRYYYLESPNTYGPMYEEAYSQAGKFMVLTYSVTNTSPQTVKANLGARLFAKAGGEVYEESDVAVHPYSGLAGGGIVRAPREMRLGQFIFDVPVDVEPRLVAVLYEDELEEIRGEAGAVDLTEENPQGPRPEEILALQYEFTNMGEWEEAYDLFAQESQDRVPLEQYGPSTKKEEMEFGAVTDYAFPSVEVEGDRATVERIITVNDILGADTQDEATQELVLEDEGWRIVMREQQVRYWTEGAPESTTASPTSSATEGQYDPGL